MSNYLSYIYRHKCGNISDLNRKFGKTSVRRMEAMGYIVNAPTKDGDTWKISSRAKKLAELRCRDNTLWERFCDWFYLKVRRIDFGI